MKKCVTIVGGGLAGSEAAFQLAERGHSVRLFEMRPVRPTEAHRTSDFAELVCSNSFGSDSPGTASRLLKDELEILGAFVLRRARQHSAPAGASLAVDRVALAKAVTEELSRRPEIEIRREEVTEIPGEGIVILATGPLTSPALSSEIQRLVGGSSLYFYDAISPIVSLDSLDLGRMFYANRYGKGDSVDFLNIPLTKGQYEELVHDLLKAEVVLPKDFEAEHYFEGCMPIESLAARGVETLRFGPLKPVGLSRGLVEKPHAVIQLRAENRYKTSYNLVGFQTKMKYGEQQRVFRKLPGMEKAEFLRLGSMHRNTYLDSPKALLPTLQLRNYERVFVAGQLTGTEGYLESTASGLLAALNCDRLLRDLEPLSPPPTTMMGALMQAISEPGKEDFQPINSNFGILPPLEQKVRDKQERRLLIARRSIASMNQWVALSRSLSDARREVNPCSCPSISGGTLV